MTEAHFAAFQAISGDNHPIHYDIEYCRSQGHDGLLAHGLQVLCYTAAGSGTFADVVGRAMVGYIDQSCRFLKPVYPGDTLYPTLRIAELKRQRTTGVIVLESEIDNQRGEAGCWRGGRATWCACSPTATVRSRTRAPRILRAAPPRPGTRGAAGPGFSTSARRALGDQRAAVEHRHSIGETGGGVQIVQHQHDGTTFVDQVARQPQQVETVGEIEVRGSARQAAEPPPLWPDSAPSARAATHLPTTSSPVVRRAPERPCRPGSGRSHPRSAERVPNKRLSCG